MNTAFSRYLAIFLLAAASLAHAADDPETGSQPSEMLPGFKANQVYASGAVDDVNLFSGDPHVTIPLGPEYPLSPFFTWRPTLHYSNKFWRIAAGACRRTITPPTGPEIAITPRARIHGFPSVGLGWTFHLGVLKPAFDPNAPNPQPGDAPGVDEDQEPIFYSADGGTHTFEAVTTGPATNVLRTRDGSRMRLHLDNGTWVVTTADGTRYEFGHEFSTPRPAVPNTSPDFTFRTVQRSDPDLHDQDIAIKMRAVTRILDKEQRVVLEATYIGWQLTSIHLPTLNATVSLAWNEKSITAGGTTATWSVITGITMPSVQGRTLNASFFFNQPEIDGFGSGANRAFPRNPNDEGIFNPDPNYTPPPAECQSPASVLVPFLDRVEVSETSMVPSGHPTTPTQAYSFAYEFGSSFAESLGSLRKIKLPTRGLIEYTYSKMVSEPPGNRDLLEVLDGSGPTSPISPPRVYQTDHGTQWDRFKFFLDSSSYVASRKTTDPTTLQESTTTYDRYQLYFSTTSAPVTKVARRVVVTSPNGNGSVNQTVHIFGVSPNRPGNGSGLELLRRSYEGTALSGLVLAGTPFRTVVNCYSSNGAAEVCGYRSGASEPFTYTSVGTMTDVSSTGSVTWYGVEPSNPRDCQSSSLTECIATVNTLWDATAGEFQRKVLSARSGSIFAPLIPGNPATLWLNRTTDTQFTSSYVSSTGPWLPKLVLRSTVTDNWSNSTGCLEAAPCTMTTGKTYESPGRVKTMTTAATAVSPTQSAILTFSSFNAQGIPEHEKREAQSTDNSFLGINETDRSYFNGLVTLSKKTALPGIKTFDVDRDPTTGLITASRDANGRVTTYRYNALGQIGAILPPFSDSPATQFKAIAPTWICRDAASGYVGGDRILVFRSFTSPPCSAFPRFPTPSPNLAPLLGSMPVETTEYDGFGRIVLEQRFNPSSTTEVRVARRRTAYATNGSVSTATNWYDVACPALGAGCYPDPPGANEPTVGRTTFSNFDPMGRALTETRPDGTVVSYSHDVPVAHSDRYDAATSYGVQSFKPVGGVNSQTLLTTQKSVLMDIFGRPMVTNERGWWDTDPNPNTQVYAFEQGLSHSHVYNVLDKLARLESTSQADSQMKQVRKFSYDVFGNLRSEAHPEDLGSQTTYGRYDILGKNLRRTEPGGTTVVSTFDALGRPTSIGVEGAGVTNYIVNEYDIPQVPAPFGGPQFSNGMLTKATSFNPQAATPLKVEQAYYYSEDSRAGLSSRKTTISSVSETLLNGYFEHFSYDPLGNLSRYAHPRASTDIPFITATDFTFGMPTRVLAGGVPVVRDVTYAAHGSVNSFVSSVGYPGVPGGAPADTAFPSVTTTIGLDPSGMSRPSFILLSGTSLNVALGSYQFDGAGNIKQIGGDKYYYDGRGRLVRSEIVDGASDDLRYTYDAFSNLTSMSNANGSWNRAFTIETQGQVPNNRLATVQEPGGSTAGVTYDLRGNVIDLPGYNESFTYDGLDRMSSSSKGGATWNYYYDAAGERIGKVGPSSTVFTLRDPGNRVVTEVRREGGQNFIVRDNFFLGGLLVGSRDVCGSPDAQQPTWRYYGSDHLASNRVEWNIAGGQLGGTRKFRPFGEGIVAGPTLQRLSFASMEQDREEQSLDRVYDHARSYDPRLGRFLSVDPLSGTGGSEGWNRFSYAANNPVRYVDPDGQDWQDVLGGTLNAFTSNQVGGAGRIDGTNSDFRLGQALGDALAAINGTKNALLGAGVFIAGFGADATGVGAIVGVPVQAAAAAVALQGTVSAVSGITHLAAAASSPGGGAPPTSGGVQTSSTTLYKGDGFRIDVENPNPSQRPGQVHIQLGDAKYLYDPAKKQFVNAPNSVNKLLENDRVRAAVEKGVKKYLGQ